LPPLPPTNPTASPDDGTALPPLATASPDDGTALPPLATASPDDGTALPPLATASPDDGTAPPPRATAVRDPYAYRHTEVLRNHAHTVDPEKLTALDRRVTGAALHALDDNPIRGRFDLQHVAGIHAAIMGDLYPWAGEFRKCEVEKQVPKTKVVVKFPPPDVAPGLLSQVLRSDVADKNNLQGLSRKEMSLALAAVTADVHFAHVFRDGNSRTTREFARTLALSAGYELDWNRVERKALLPAIFARTFNAKDPGLAKLIEGAIVNPRPDPEIKRIYDDATPPPLPLRGTIGEAVARSAAETRTKAAFVDASWEDSARVRLWSAREVLTILEKTRAAMPQKQADALEYGVRSVGGAVFHVASNKDVFVRLDHGRTDYPERLQIALGRHFDKSPDVDASKKGRDRDGPDFDGP
jgi:cell filamentation protein